VDKPLKSVTHGWCDARPMVTFPAREQQVILLGDRGTCVNNLPLVLNWKRSWTCKLWVASPTP